MKSLKINLILVMLVFLTFAHADDDDETKIMPKVVISNFFKNLENGDIEKLKELLSPGRYEAYQKAGVWNKWLNTWRRCKPTVLGKITERKNYLKKGRDKTVSVSVTYDCDGETLSDSITISKFKGTWLWDEN